MESSRRGSRRLGGCHFPRTKRGNQNSSFFRPAGRLGPQPQPFAGLSARVGTCFAHSSTTPLERRFTEQGRAFVLFPVDVPVPEQTRARKHQDHITCQLAATSPTPRTILWHVVITNLVTVGTDTMIDPISIAGLTIAVIDDLIKLSVFTAQLVDDVKAFDDVSYAVSQSARPSLSSRQADDDT